MNLPMRSHPAPFRRLRPAPAFSLAVFSLAVFSLAVFLLAALVLLPAAGEAAELEPCPEIENAQCGKLEVFENRQTRSGRTIELNTVVLDSDAPEDEEKAPLFFLAGGPGQGATAFAPFLRQGQAAELLANRDVVLVDQRGTGDSNQLQCPPPEDPAGFFGHIFLPAEVAACRRELEQKADLGLYTTSVAMDDLDDVRAWLGYEQIVVMGGSYGTRAAMEYMRRHPDHVERAVLDGIAAFSAYSPLFYAHGAQLALEQTLADCENDAACDAAYPELREDFFRVLEKFRQGPLMVEIKPGEDAEPIEVAYSIGDFGYTIRGMLYNPPQTAQLPMLLKTAAEEGDLTPFAQAYHDRAAAIAQGISHGMYLSVLCAEDLPFFDQHDTLRWTAGTYLGDFLIDDYKAACAEWVQGEIPPGYHEPLKSDIPTLVLSGGRDPVTPPHWGDLVAEHLTNGRHIVFAEAGHGVGVGTQCGFELVSSFLDGTPVDELDASCTGDVTSRVPFALPGEDEDG